MIPTTTKMGEPAEFQSPAEISDKQMNTRCQFCPTTVAEESSLYTCPRCQRRYCSLGCYRSQAHVDCSESFYKACVDEGLRTGELKDRKPAPVIEALRRQAASDEADGLGPIDPVLRSVRSESPDGSDQLESELSDPEGQEEDDDAYITKVRSRLEAALEEGGEGLGDLETELSQLGLSGAGPKELLSVLSPAERTAFAAFLGANADRVDWEEVEEDEAAASPGDDGSCFRKPAGPPKKPRLSS